MQPDLDWTFGEIVTCELRLAQPISMIIPETRGSILSARYALATTHNVLPNGFRIDTRASRTTQRQCRVSTTSSNSPQATSISARATSAVN